VIHGLPVRAREAPKRAEAAPDSDGDDVADGEGEVFRDGGTLRHEGARSTIDLE
jgi:hypothetical protein